MAGSDAEADDDERAVEEYVAPRETKGPELVVVVRESGAVTVTRDVGAKRGRLDGMSPGSEVAVLLGKATSEHLCIDFLRRTYPTAEEYWDAN